MLSFLWFFKSISRAGAKSCVNPLDGDGAFTRGVSELHAYPMHVSSGRQARQVQVRKAATSSSVLALRVAVLALQEANLLLMPRTPAWVLPEEHREGQVLHTPWLPTCRQARYHFEFTSALVLCPRKSCFQGRSLSPCHCPSVAVVLMGVLNGLNAQQI